MLKIVNVPNSILNKPVKRVAKIDKEIIELIKKMDQILMAQKDPQGVGLAAPQVGINLAIFIIKPTVKAETEVFINPKIIKSLKVHKVESQKKKKKTKLEGCLSIPRIWGPVKRADKIYLEYQNLSTGAVERKWFSGFKAVIIQHEMDHLQGILFTQRVIEQKKQLFEEKDNELKKIDFSV